MCGQNHLSFPFLGTIPKPPILFFFLEGKPPILGDTRLCQLGQATQRPTSKKKKGPARLLQITEKVRL